MSKSIYQFFEHPFLFFIFTFPSVKVTKDSSSLMRERRYDSVTSGQRAALPDLWRGLGGVQDTRHSALTDRGALVTAMRVVGVSMSQG